MIASPDLPLPPSHTAPEDIVQKHFLPVYSPENQISTSAIIPQEVGSYGDPILQAISVERTRALHDKKVITGGPSGLPSPGIEWAIQYTSDRVGQHFQTHGFGNKVDPVAAIEEIMSKGINHDRTLYTTEFRYNPEAGPAIGAVAPFAEGGIVLLGKYDAQLIDSGIHYVIVGDEFVKVIDLLRQRYPKVEIIPWHDAPQRLTSIHNKAAGEHIEAVTLQENNHPEYKNTRVKKRIMQAKTLEDIVTTKDIPADSSDIW